MAKRKDVNFLVIKREDEEDLYALLDELVAAHHDDLSEARIALAWRFGWKADPDGRLQLGQCRKASDLDRLLHDLDFVILLNYEAWHAVEFSEEQKRALLDHELCHGALRLDENDEPVEDVNGRKVYRIRKHTIEEFHEVVERNGLWKADIASFAATAMEAKRLPLFAPPSDAVRRAVADLAPREGSGIDSVTISALGKSATLTKADGERLRRELRKGGRSAKRKEARA